MLRHVMLRFGRFLALAGWFTLASIPSLAPQVNASQTIEVSEATATQPPRGRSGRGRTPSANERNHASVKQAFADLLEPYKAATVRIVCDGDPVALGTIVDSNGLLVTKASLLKGKTVCQLSDGRELTAQRLGVDDSFDLAVLKIDASDLQPVKWREGSPPTQGSFVVSPNEQGDAQAIGLITVEPRRFNLRLPPPPDPKASERGFLGVSVQAGDEGLQIINVVDDSAAAKAGLKVGDVLTKVNEITPKVQTELTAELSKFKPGETIKLAWKRSDKELAAEAKLGKRPAQLSRPPSDRWGGGPFSERRFGFPRVVVHDTVLSPNRVGGPVVDLDGNVAGINIARALRVSTYAVPAGDVQQIVKRFADRITARPVPASPTRHIRAAGVEGTLVLCGSQAATPEALEAFVRTVGDRQLLVVQSADADSNANDNLQRLTAAWQAADGPSLLIVRADQEGSQLPKQIEAAGGIWWDLSAEELRTSLSNDAVKDAADALLARGGVMGGPLDFAETAARNGSAAAQQWLPAAIIRSDSDAADVASSLTENATSVAFRLSTDGTMLVKGRSIVSVGGGTIQIEYAPSKHYPAKTLTLSESRRAADLTAIRRFAVQRTLPIFPTREAAKPIVDEGTLVIVGGGGMPRGMVSRFVELAGGETASIVVIPISMPAPLPERDSMAAAFERAGAAEVTVLRGRTPDDVESDESLEALRKATGVWFGGGRQWRFIDAYEGTQAAALMHQILERGGVIGGSSAGASIQGEYMARGDPLGSRRIMADGYERGLAFLPGVAIDQHFSQRRRFSDMSSLVDRYPQLLGIGIDEGTALVVQGSVAEVVGRTRVCFYNRRESTGDGQNDYVSVASGDKYDLVNRIPISQYELPPAPNSKEVGDQKQAAEAGDGK